MFFLWPVGILAAVGIDFFWEEVSCCKWKVPIEFIHPLSLPSSLLLPPLSSLLCSKASFLFLPSLLLSLYLPTFLPFVVIAHLFLDSPAPVSRVFVPCSWQRWTNRTVHLHCILEFAITFFHCTHAAETGVTRSRLHWRFLSRLSLRLKSCRRRAAGG